MNKALKKKIFNRCAREYSKSYSPSGKTDKGGRWYPDDSEERKCCKYIRQPSRDWPWSLYKHCGSIKHIKNDPQLKEKVEEICNDISLFPIWISSNDYMEKLVSTIVMDTIQEEDNKK